MRVGHCIQRYPVKELAYIRDQVLLTPTRHDSILPIWGLGNEDPALSSPPVLPVFDLRGRSISHAPAATRAMDAVSRRLSPKVLGGIVRWRLDSRVGGSFDLLHAHFATTATLYLDLSARHSLPLVTTFYGVDASACLKDRRWLRRFSRLFAMGAAFIVLSDAVKARLARAGCPAERTVVWNIGFDLSKYPYAPSVRRPGPFRLLCAARFVEKKGQRRVLEGLSRLRGQGPFSLTLMGYGPGAQELSFEAARLGVSDTVQFIDTSREPDFTGAYLRELRSHDAFILTSIEARDGDDEGGPALTMVYAHAAGLPVITSSFPGVERTVTDGESGLIVDADDPSSIGASILRLATSPELGRRLAANARRRVEREFSLDSQLAKLHSLYTSVIGRNDSRPISI